MLWQLFNKCHVATALGIVFQYVVVKSRSYIVLMVSVSWLSICSSRRKTVYGCGLTVDCSGELSVISGAVYIKL